MIRILLQAEFPNLEVDPKVVRRLLGYSDPSKASPAIQGIFNQAMEIGQSILEPSASYDIFQTKRVTSSSVEVEGDVLFESQDLGKRKDC